MFLDTSIIIEIFRNKENTEAFQKIYKLIKDENLFISVIQIGEISDWCLKNDIDPTERISQLKRIVNIVPLSEKICLKGSKAKYRYRKEGITNFSLIDGIILASAQLINQNLLTKDTDFEKAKDAIVVDSE
jgi:predicted nucleic acid-binding protein